MDGVCAIYAIRFVLSFGTKRNNKRGESIMNFAEIAILMFLTIN